MTHFDQTNSYSPTAVTQEDRNFGMLIWGLNFFFPIIAPLLFMLTQQSAFVQETSKEAINFGISYLVYGAIAGALMAVLIGLLLAPLVAVAFLVFSVLGLMAASKGQLYRVPAIFRLIK